MKSIDDFIFGFNKGKQKGKLDAEISLYKDFLKEVGVRIPYTIEEERRWAKKFIESCKLKIKEISPPQSFYEKAGYWLGYTFTEKR